MKVFAESQPPGESSYIHLGYLAATPPSPLAGTLETGLLLGFVGALLSLRFQQGQTPSGRSATYLKLRRSSLGRVGVILLLGMVLVLCAGYMFRDRTPTHPHLGTQNRMRSVGTLILLEALDRKDSFPSHRLKEGLYDVDLFLRLHHITNATLWDARRALTRDLWGNRMTIAIPSAIKRRQIGIISAGRDLQLGTPDDLRFDVEIPESGSTAKEERTQAGP